MEKISPNDKLVHVCDACLRASCLNGEFYCEEYKTAGIRSVSVKELAGLNLEDSHYYLDTKYKTDLDSEACYRACRDAGMTDPEKTIPAMVEALRDIKSIACDLGRFNDAEKLDIAADSIYMHAKQALATLNDESEV